MSKLRPSQRRRSNAPAIRRSPFSRQLRIEPLEERRLLAVAAGFDYGDAPEPYPTSLADDGPRHEAIGPTLGILRDEELDGQPSAAADGDGADEDSVTFGPVRVGQLDASVTVNVQNAPAGAKLDAWIDFNGDGSWGGPGEHIFDGASVEDGDNDLLFDVPSWATAGNTYARFRLSTEGDLGVSGSAADGEVEDYPLTINPPATATGIFVGPNIISTAADRAYSVFAADVDGDGDLDVLGAFNRGGKIAWYENDGGEDFTAHTISTTANGARSVFAADVDGDGDIDVLSAASGRIAWYENDGNQGFTDHTIATTANRARSVFAADVDGDGDLDVLSASERDNKIAWYENDGSQGFMAHTITTTANRAQSVFAADVDGDGDIDVLSASRTNGKIAWYENDGREGFTDHVIRTDVDQAYSVFAADVDGDGDIDVLSASGSRFGGKIAWYENDGSEGFTDHTISILTERAYSVIAADVDGDGDLDVLSASDFRFAGSKIALYENDGSEGFIARTISATADGVRSVFAADVDGDGDLDVLSASREGDKIAWYENLSGVDFGDAPAPYPTLTSAAGAVHVARGPTLGTKRDVEEEGQPTELADGDGDDDDGVTFGEIRVGGLDASVRVNVQNAPAGAKLDAWIDFNGDGSWGGPGEQVFDGAAVDNGNNDLEFDVPSWAASGDTYARFRLSTAGDAGIGGGATDGEVEDYRLTIDPPAPASGMFFAEHTISTNADSASSVIAADVDGDGDMDVLSASVSDDRIAWYENDGSGGFTTHNISTTVDGPYSVFAADVDGDGDVDVLSASDHDDTIAWHENDGSQGFTTHIISAEIRDAKSVFAADVDGDGDIDVLSTSSASISWHENDGSEGFTAHVISSDAAGGFGLFAADVDGDGDMDVLNASYRDNKVAWYENDGSEAFAAHIISTDAGGAVSVFAADVDGDGDLDVLSAPAFDSSIAWYENDGNESFTAHAISTNAEGAFGVFAADVDGDGDVDVLSASQLDDKIAWYENDGTETFLDRTISTTAGGAISVFAADLDGDGDLDVLIASIRDDTIAWYENLPSTGFDYGDAPESYATLNTDEGASHLAQGPTLGASRDVEDDGQPTATADGDGDDDDGVVFKAIHGGQLNAAVTVNVQNAPDGARLDAWIDFDGDGTWGAPREQIFDGASVHNGDNALIFDVPSWAINGDTYARFRLSSEGGLGVVGLAADGEVEDYLLTIDPFVPAPGVFTGPNIISTDADGATSVFAVDVDGDGDIDVLSASKRDDKIAWYDNDGSGGFTPHTISTVADGAKSVFAVDVDGDGDIDVLSASERDSKIAWYENDGSEQFMAHTISTAANYAQSVFAVDVDGDGDIDVLSASERDSKIAWYENDGSEQFMARTISTAANYAQSVFAVDVDGDGDVDVLSASSRDDKIAWYENDGSEGFTIHNVNTPDPDNDRRNVFEGNADSARSVFATDVDGDGDIDVLSASVYDDKIAWYENDGSEGFTAHTISTATNAAWSVFAIDVDGDGDIDVLSAGSKITWHENAGNRRFRAHTISNTTDGAIAVFAVDLDGDGDTDVLSALSDGKIAWYENLSPITPEPPADLTGDGFVDTDDLIVLLANWNTLGGPELGDLFDDPAKPGINSDDLFVLLAAWTGPDPGAPPQAAVRSDRIHVVGRAGDGDPMNRVTASDEAARRDTSSEGRMNPATTSRWRSARRSRPADRTYGRLQAVAVDRALREEAAFDRHERLIARRAGRRA